jgi:hypothetical protein
MSSKAPSSNTATKRKQAFWFPTIRAMVQALSRLASHDVSEYGFFLSWLTGGRNTKKPLFDKFKLILTRNNPDFYSHMQEGSHAITEAVASDFMHSVIAIEKISADSDPSMPSDWWKDQVSTLACTNKDKKAFWVEEETVEEVDEEGNVLVPFDNESLIIDELKKILGTISSQVIASKTQRSENIDNNRQEEESK